MISFDLKVLQQGMTDLAGMHSKLVAAQRAFVGEESAETMDLALIQMHRFILGNIEVDTTRTKNSIFMKSGVDGDGPWGKIGSNVKYSPWVRDAGHGTQFMEYAVKKEGPAVLALLGKEYTLAVHKKFQ